MLYLTLCVVTAAALLVYIVIQWRYGTDYKELGAGALTFVVGIHRLWTLVRLIRILQRHAKLVQVLQICDKKMSDLAVEMLQFRGISYSLFRTMPGDLLGRHLTTSASLFDDDYPGDSARISWLRKKVRVHPDDANECIARIAIWMRAVIRYTNVSIWDVLTGSSFVGYQSRQSRRRSLYNTLIRAVQDRFMPVTRREIYGNPAEELLNHPGEDQLEHIGIGVVWWATRMRGEEINQIVSEIPASWMNDTLLSGKELMIEMGVCLILTGMQSPTILEKVCVRDMEDVQGGQFWQNTDILFAEAVAGLVYLDWGSGNDDDDDSKSAVVTSTEHKSLIDDVRKGLTCLRAELKLKDLEETHLTHRLQHLITGAYYGGYVIEGVLGHHASHVYLPSEMVEYPLYQAELAFVLYDFLRDVGWCDGENISHRQTDNIRCNWFICRSYHYRACPATVFRRYVMDAGEAARNVIMAFKGPYIVKPIMIKDDETRRLWFG